MDNSASFAFSWYDDHFHPIEFAATSGFTHKWQVHYPLKNDLNDHGAFNVVKFWLSQNPDRFTGIRWYADAD